MLKNFSEKRISEVSLFFDGFHAEPKQPRNRHRCSLRVFRDILVGLRANLRDRVRNTVAEFEHSLIIDLGKSARQHPNT
jgi:hypothetical protein